MIKAIEFQFAESLKIPPRRVRFYTWSTMYGPDLRKAGPFASLRSVQEAVPLLVVIHVLK